MKDDELEEEIKGQFFELDKWFATKGTISSLEEKTEKLTTFKTLIYSDNDDYGERGIIVGVIAGIVVTSSY